MHRIPEQPNSPIPLRTRQTLCRPPGFIAKGVTVIGAWLVTQALSSLDSSSHCASHLRDTSPGQRQPRRRAAPLSPNSMNLRLPLGYHVNVDGMNLILPWDTMQTQVSIVANGTIDLVNSYPLKLYYDVVLNSSCPSNCLRDKLSQRSNQARYVATLGFLLPCRANRRGKPGVSQASSGPNI